MTVSKADWIAALRSGDYEQCKDYFHDSDQFCAIGVFYDLGIKAGRGRWHEAPAGHFLAEGVGTINICGLRSVKITEDNDKGFTFTQIADKAEAGDYDC